MDLRLFNIVSDAGMTGDAHLELRATVPFKSLVWEEQYATVGTMQAVFARDADALNLVKVGLLASYTDTQVLMYIHSVKVTDTEIWAYGFEAKALFAKKPLHNFGISYGTVDIVDAITNWYPSNKMRWMADEFVAEDMGEANLDGLKYENMYDYIQGCCAIDGFGFFVAWDHTEDGIKGVLYISHGGLNDITLSSALGNVRDVTYTLSDKPYYNSVWAIGELPHNARVYRQGLTSDDEIYTYIMDLGIEFPQPDDMTDAGYIEALRVRALISLGMRHNMETIEVGSIEADCEWGDIVHVLIPDIGVTTTKRVIGITYTSEAGITTKKYKLGEV